MHIKSVSNYWLRVKASKRKVTDTANGFPEEKGDLKASFREKKKLNLVHYENERKLEKLKIEYKISITVTARYFTRRKALK